MAIHSNNAIHMMRRSLERDIKREILNNIIEDQVSKLKDVIIPMLDEIIFDKIDSFHDLLSMRDEYRVLIRINDKVSDSNEV